MKKKVKKLKLTRETLETLGSHVLGGISIEGPTYCGATCIRQCKPIPSVDGCGSNLIACASQPYGCQSGLVCM